MFKVSKQPYRSTQYDKIISSSTTTSMVAKKWTRNIGKKSKNPKNPKLKLKIYWRPKIKSSPVDRFWYLRCLNNHIEVSDIIRSFASGATASLVVKIWTKQPWVKIENLCNFDHSFALCRGKFDYGYFIIFLRYSFTILLKKFQAILSKKEGMTFSNFWFFYKFFFKV